MYNHESENMLWARAQMQELGVPELEIELIEQLLDDYWTVAVGQGWRGEYQDRFLKMFTDLAIGHAIVAQGDDEDAVWVQVRPGQIVAGQRVRVRKDAYQGSAGTIHNGRLGAITAIRYGDIHVKYVDGKEPHYDDIRHSPQALEKRVK